MAYQNTNLNGKHNRFTCQICRAEEIAKSYSSGLTNGFIIGCVFTLAILVTIILTVK